MDFTVESHYTPHLAPGTGQVDAIVSVSLEADGAPTGSAVGGAPGQMNAGAQAHVLGFIADRSGSMHGPRIRAVREALQAAVSALDPAVTFFIVGFDTDSTVILAPAQATEQNKRLATERLATLDAGGGTAMSTGLEMALGFFRRYPDAIRQALFLTDGKNESERIAAVRSVLEACACVFECDCWGLGTDWQVGEVQEIARALNGKAALLPDPRDVEAAFRAFVDKAQNKAIRDVRLRLWAPQGAELTQVRQMNPTIEELAGRTRPVTPLIRDYPTGAW